jgi:tetratricopeptide (TPR) repeat protein
MSFAQKLVLVIAFLHAATIAVPRNASTQDWSGSGRLAGKVTDTKGQPLVGVTVKLELEGRGTTNATTDKKGRWAVLGVAAGTWNLDFELAGYVPKSLVLQLPSESARLPSIDVQLEAAAPAGPPPEVLATKGRAEQAMKEGRFADSRAEWEKLLVQVPALASSIRREIAITYIREKENEKALAELDASLAADPADHLTRAIAAQAALDAKLFDRARQYLAVLDENAIKSPDFFFDVGVHFVNAGQMADAAEWFGKTIRLDPAAADAYFRRGLCHVNLAKTQEAKADFQKVLELQPEGQMADMAKKALEQLK